MNNELNRVVLGFLRQVLGVHKKNTSLAIMAETGKLPISFKIFNSIFKYWIRAFTCNSNLVREAIICNKNHPKGGQSWTKIVNFLLQITDMEDIIPTDNLKDNEKILKVFKNRLRTKLLNAIQDEMKNSPKLDFYNKFKKVFKFEAYLDNVPRHLRVYTTRLRLSSHHLPVEILRYSKKKIERKDRICKFCTLKELGDEDHYLKRCKLMTDLKKSFMTNIKKSITTFQHFKEADVIDYCMIMHDTRIFRTFSTYIQDILIRYKEVTENAGHDPHKITQTRSGRVVKIPEKLNL